MSWLGYLHPRAGASFAVADGVALALVAARFEVRDCESPSLEFVSASLSASRGMLAWARCFCT